MIFYTVSEVDFIENLQPSVEKLTNVIKSRASECILDQNEF